jgi:hypothetical protein
LKSRCQYAVAIDGHANPSSGAESVRSTGAWTAVSHTAGRTGVDGRLARHGEQRRAARTLLCDARARSAKHRIPSGTSVEESCFGQRGMSACMYAWTDLCGAAFLYLAVLALASSINQLSSGRPQARALQTCFLVLHSQRKNKCCSGTTIMVAQATRWKGRTRNRSGLEARLHAHSTQPPAGLNCFNWGQSGGAIAQSLLDCHGMN